MSATGKETTVEDAQLVQHVREGNPAAFETLVRRHQEAVYSYVYHRLGSCADAQDVTQEVFLAAYQTLDRLEQPDRFAAWLRGIAVNHCRRHWQRGSPLVWAAVDGETALWKDQRPSPQEALERQEQDQCLE